MAVAVNAWAAVAFRMARRYGPWPGEERSPGVGRGPDSAGRAATGRRRSARGGRFRCRDATQPRERTDIDDQTYEPRRWRLREKSPPAAAALNLIILSANHRAGSTLLQRICNARKGTLIWGEHGGALRYFSEIYASAGYFAVAGAQERDDYFRQDENPNLWIASMSPGVGVRPTGGRQFGPGILGDALRTIPRRPRHPWIQGGPIRSRRNPVASPVLSGGAPSASCPQSAEHLEKHAPRLVVCVAGGVDGQMESEPRGAFATPPRPTPAAI